MIGSVFLFTPILLQNMLELMQGITKVEGPLFLQCVRDSVSRESRV